MTIVSTLDRAVGPDAVEKIARALGIDIPTVRGAVAAALPALLAMLAGKGEKVPGAGTIFDAIRDGTGPHDLASLFEDGERDAVARAVGRYGGIGEAQSVALLGTLGPMVLDVLAGEIERLRLDKTALCGFLRDQRTAIAEALPDGFACHMSGSRYFDAFRTGFAADTTAPMTDTTRPDPVALAEADYAETVKEPALMRIGIAAILALLAGAWIFHAIGTTTSDPVPPSPPATLERGAN